MFSESNFYSLCEGANKWAVNCLSDDSSGFVDISSSDQGISYQRHEKQLFPREDDLVEVSGLDFEN